MKHLLFALAAVALGALAFAAQDTGGAKIQGAAADNSAVVKKQLPSYPLDTCVISGEKLTANGGPVDHVVKGRLIRVCCKGCVKPVDSDPAAAIAKVDAAVVRAQKKSYPLDTCVVSGEKLGSMGEVIDVVEGTRLARLCCKGCKKGFAKDPGKHMAKIDEALIAQQLKSYPLETCLVSDEPLDAMGGPLDQLYGTQLVRLCCKGCKKGFAKDPAKFLAKLDEARSKNKAKAEKPKNKG